MHRLSGGLRIPCRQHATSTPSRFAEPKFPVKRLKSSQPKSWPIARHASTSSRNKKTSSEAADKRISLRLNPPASTRPPQLARPNRSAFESSFKYYFAVGKAFVFFYRDGLKAVFKNRREVLGILDRLDMPIEKKPKSLLWLRPSRLVPPPPSLTRAEWVSIWRARHDWIRVPLFGLIVAICGEFTPLVVLAAPGAVPLTCRVPEQALKSLRKAEGRREEAFRYMGVQYGGGAGVYSPNMTAEAARAHVLRVLNLTSTTWDRLGLVVPGSWGMKGESRLAFLDGDDAKLVEGGGPMGLCGEEIRIACTERGIDVLGRGESELMAHLGDWLRLTAAEDMEEKRRRVAVLLLTRTENWPQTRDFALPEWKL